MNERYQALAVKITEGVDALHAENGATPESISALICDDAVMDAIDSCEVEDLAELSTFVAKETLENITARGVETSKNLTDKEIEFLSIIGYAAFITVREVTYNNVIDILKTKGRKGRKQAKELEKNGRLLAQVSKAKQINSE